MGGDGARRRLRPRAFESSGVAVSRMLRKGANPGFLFVFLGLVSESHDVSEAGAILVQGFDELFHQSQLDVKVLGLLESSAALSGHTTQQKGAYALFSGFISLIPESRVPSSRCARVFSNYLRIKLKTLKKKAQNS